MISSSCSFATILSFVNKLSNVRILSKQPTYVVISKKRLY